MAELSIAPSRAALRRPVRLCSDEQLARRAALGDQRAFSEVFERHHQAIYRYCRAILRSDEDAADALQNTMAAVLRALPGETREIALKAWLFRIAHNEALGIARRRRPQMPLEEGQACRLPGLEAGVLQAEQMRQLVCDVRALPDRQRSALVMRELNDMGYAEIAAVFEVREGAARQAVHEAREMLQEFEQGRSMNCVDVRELIDARDRRLLSGRKIRAHLRACELCEGYRAAIGARRAALAAVAPPMAAPLVASVLHGLLGGGGGGGGAAGTGVAAAGASTTAQVTALAGVSTQASAGAALAVKAAAIIAATASLGGGAIIAERQMSGPEPSRATTSAGQTSGQPTSPGSRSVATAARSGAVTLPGAAPQQTVGGARSGQAQPDDRPAPRPSGTPEPAQDAGPVGSTGAPVPSRVPNDVPAGTRPGPADRPDGQPTTPRPSPATSPPPTASERRPSGAANAPTAAPTGTAPATPVASSPNPVITSPDVVDAAREIVPATSTAPAVPLPAPVGGR